MDAFDILSFIVGTIIGCVGVYFTIIVIRVQKPLFYKETVKIIDPTVIDRTMNILNPDQNLKITYGNIPISTLSSTYITFWNAGKQTIKKEDIPSTAPITIKPKEGVKIFRVSFLKVKDENLFQPQQKFTQENYWIEILFEYLAKNDGMKLQVIHSGVSNDDLVFTGKTKDYGDFRDIVIYKKERQVRYKVILILSTVLFLIISGGLLVFNILGNLTLAIDFIYFLIMMFLIGWGFDIILDFFYPSIPKNLQ